MTDDHLWQTETEFWTGPAETAISCLHPQVVMVFAQTGVLRHDAIAAAITAAPRWDSVEITERQRVDENAVTVLVYRAAGRRGDDITRVFCLSTWVAGGEGWRLLSHQQTPLPAHD